MTKKTESLRDKVIANSKQKVGHTWFDRLDSENQQAVEQIVEEWRTPNSEVRLAHPDSKSLARELMSQLSLDYNVETVARMIRGKS